VITDWAPDEHSISEVRRALYRLDGEAVSVVVELLRVNGACDEAVLRDLVRTAKMHSLLTAARRPPRINLPMSVGLAALSKHGHCSAL